MVIRFETMRRKKKIKALIAEIDYLEKAGRLVDAKHMEVIAFQTYRDVRDGVLNLPDRLSGALAAKVSELFCEKPPSSIVVQVDAALTKGDWQEIVYLVLTNEVQELLNDLSHRQAELR